MKVTDTSLRRPVTVIVLTIALVYFGIYAYFNMGMEQTPDVDLPVVMVTTTMRGATAAVMDNDVTDVLEEQINTISGIESLSSSSYMGAAVTVVEFDMDRDIDAAAADVRDKVNAAKANLPDEADEPIIAKLDINDSPVVMFSVTGPASYKDKVYFVDKVAKVKLQSLNGVGNVNTPGLRDREIRVWIDPVRLRSRGLVVQDLSNAIASKHVELPAGSLNIDRFKMDLRIEGEYSSVDEMKSLPITTRDGVVIRLGEVADVEDGFEEQENIAYDNGQQTILVAVQKQRGANEVAT
ncbi:MAG: efflux RND transporter permease subunit, partial [Pyramidobacter sp.]|nr:efflux RND transporter permease subunit [Pyramidobacter sp.]